MAVLGGEDVHTPVRPHFLEEPYEQRTKTGVGLSQRTFEDVVVENAKPHCYQY